MEVLGAVPGNSYPNLRSRNSLCGGYCSLFKFRRTLMVSLDLLRNALKPISKVGQDELSFEIQGVRLVLRPLTQKEEIAAQKILAPDEGLPDGDQFTALEFFTKFRVEVLAYSIVEVNGLDLRDSPKVETGEATPSGIPIKVEKHVAIRELVESWPRQLLTFAFSKYGELAQRVTEQLDSYLEKNESDLDTEIARLEARLEDVRKQRISRAAGNAGISQEALMDLIQKSNDDEIARAQAVTIGDAVSDRVRARKVEEPKEEPPPRQEPQPELTPPPRKSVIPTSVPPPTSDQNFPPQQEVTSFGDFLSSFGGDDLDSVAAEERRILESRSSRAAMPKSPPPVQEPVDPIAQARPAGKVGNVDAFRLPTEVISERGRGVPSSNPVQGQTSVNPNFRSPKR